MPPNLWLIVGHQRIALDTSHPPHELAATLDFDGAQIEAFGLPPASRRPYQAGDFIARVSQGSPVNCDLVQIAPHGNGTHTETAWHVLPDAPGLDSLRLDPLIPATVLSVQTELLADTADSYPAGAPHDRVISRASLERAWTALELDVAWTQALVILTRCGDHLTRWSGTNPPYLSAEAMAWVRSLGTTHLLVDLPSVDREEDSGRLDNHRCFWDLQPRGQRATLSDAAARRTITELIVAPPGLADGAYLLSLHIMRWRLDAAPSWPRLFSPERE
jgi:kynurenine formamidase